MKIISIIGYELGGYCEHCGRHLKHCIRISDGRVVGATCFDKIITKPKLYNGKKYRIGSNNVIRYAQIASMGNLSKYGLTQNQLNFELA